MRNDVDVYRWRIAKKSVHCGKIEILTPVTNWGTAEDDLSDVLAADEFGYGVGNAMALKADYLCP